VIYYSTGGAQKPVVPEKGRNTSAVFTLVEMCDADFIGVLTKKKVVKRFMQILQGLQLHDLITFRSIPKF